jgi:hypothetical protein
MNFDSSFLDNFIRSSIADDEESFLDHEEDEEVTRIVRNRNRQPTPDLWLTGWGLMLSNNAVKDPTTFQGMS